jgi:hypothetical protein
LRRYLLLPILLALSAPCWGQTATELIQSRLIEAPDSVAEGKLVSILLPPDLPFKIEPAPVNKLSFLDEETGKRAYLILEAKSPGYTITIDYAVVHPTEEEIKSAPWDDRAKFAEWLAKSSKDEVYQDSHFVKVGAGPTPGPDPPTPGPDPPSPAPIPEPGFRVLIIYESADLLPQGQQVILFGREVRDYLNRVCVAESTGTKAFRIFDQHVDATGELKTWKDAMARKRDSVPWIVVSNGTTGFEGPLPKTAQEFLELCKKYEVK